MDLFYYKRALLSVVNYLSPKFEKTVLSSFPDLDDMTRAILSYMKEKERPIIILTKSSREEPPPWVDKKLVLIVKKHSLKGYYHILTAKYIFYTHGIAAAYTPSKKQVVVNLWHAMHVKKCGYQDGQKIVPRFHYTLASSQFFVPLMMETFGVSKEQVLVTGLPRNDILFLETKNDELLRLKHKYSYIYNWVPTYRASSYSDGRVDSEKFEIFTELFNAEELNKKLQLNNALLILKPHPMEAGSGFYKELAKKSNVLLASDEWFYSNGISLYELLSIVDILWTDYSSVFVDFLVLDRKIFFIIPDLEEYESKRGFSFDFKKDCLPGEVIEDFDGLMNAINNQDVINASSGVEKYNEFKGGNTERLLGFIYNSK